jgi:DNA-binding NtrC family response regulator
MPRALIVEDEPSFLTALATLVRAEGFDVEEATTLAEARPLLRDFQPDVLLLDLHLPDGSGVRLLEERDLDPVPESVLITGQASVETAVQALRSGASDYLTKPPDIARLKMILGNVTRNRALKTEVQNLRGALRRLGRFGRMVGSSPQIQSLFDAMGKVAPTDATVLIVGETGTGKELIARAVHSAGPRQGRPLIKLNCAALPAGLVESELFGHEKGAFSGAIARKIGRFERAIGGTLFLDEIGDMSLVLQSKILRAVQEREIERVGGTEPISVDVRLIAATHRDLRTFIEDGRFREDLYYRLAVVSLKLPRLADRDEDLFLLTSSFLMEFGPRYGKHFTGITDQAMALLRSHEWIGNVRELRNVIERAVLVADGDVLRSEHLPEAWRTAPETEKDEDPATIRTLREMEARHIAKALAHTHGHLSDAARMLGVHRNTLARKVKEYGL